MAKKKPKKKKLNPRNKKILETEYQKAKQTIESYLSSQKAGLRKDRVYLTKDPEEHPFSIYFTQDTPNNYAVHIGIRLTKTKNLVARKRGELQERAYKEPFKIEIDSPFYSTSLISRDLAVILASRFYDYFLDTHQPCDINFRTYSKRYDSCQESLGKTASIIFDNKRRYQSSNNKLKTTPLRFSASHTLSTTHS